MTQSTFRRYAMLSQLGLLIIFFLINFMESVSWSPFEEAFVLSFNYTMMVLGTVAVNYFFLLPIYLRGDRTVFFLLLFGVMTAFISLCYFIESLLPFDLDYGVEWDGVLYDYLILIITVSCTSLFYFVEEWFKNISTEAQLRNEKLQAELNFLKSQINPHFLFNTLNNIYAYAQTGNEKTAPMLERLSSILRYMVYDCVENRVQLHKELEAIENLLEINKMKNSAQRNITLTVEGVKGYHLIAPLILVNIVENACKHSDVISNTAGFIRVKVFVNSSNEGVFEISNSIKQKTVPASKYGGIGFENVKKRLDLQYGEAYSLEKEQTEAVYQIKLSIPLERKK